MINDIVTMIWKEWREVIVNRRGLRGGVASIAVVLFIIGVFMPLQTGADWLNNPTQLLIWSWLPIFISLSIVTDSFAGERERHTLETLLASRLSDQAILFGKIVSVVLYAWLLTVASVLAGAVTINVAVPADGIQFYPLDSLVISLTLSLLAAVLIACIGVLVSLRAPTARQAYQRMSIVLVVFWFIPMLAAQFLPEETLARFVSFFAAIDITRLILGVGIFLLLADAVLLYVVRARFQRSKLILD
jgi:ABC-2 type transport system permease protein